MITLIRETKPKARKRYNCDGREQIQVYDVDREHEDAKRQAELCGDIQKGQTYISQFCKDGGDVWTFKTCLGCNDILEKYKLYEDD